jgi:hypothetical protein
MKMRGLLVGAMTLVGLACSPVVAEREEAPEIALDELLDEEQTVAYGSWTATALQPELSGTSVRGRTNVSGNGLTNVGNCLLAQVLKDGSGETASCEAKANCAQYKIPYEHGDAYCLAIDGVGAKTCFVRPGSTKDFCTGSPATENKSPVDAGTVSTPGPWRLVLSGPFVAVPWGGVTVYHAVWVSYTCFACLTSTPVGSVSPALYFTGYW